MLGVLLGLAASAEMPHCNIDDQHHPAASIGAGGGVGGAGHDGFYIEGIAGIINDEIDLETGKRADNGTWAPGYYKHGEEKLCTGVFCSDADRVTPKRQYVPVHTCARLRFEYAADSGSTVYELPDQAALDACDFTSATLLCDENAGNPCDILYDYDHEHTFYYYASKQGCESGQKAAIQIHGNHEDLFQQNFNRGVGSYRIKHCDCNHQYRRSTLVDPAHTGFVYGCLSDMPDDQSCCPDPDSGVYYDHSISMGRGYRNGTGGTDNTGTCIAKSIMAAALERVPIMHHAMTHEDSAARAALAAFDGVDCPSKYIGWNINPSYDPIWGPMCPAYKAIQRCNVASPPADCSFDANWVAWNMPGHEWTYAGSFTDDDGVTHTWTNPTPKIVTHPFAALALIEAGLPATQIHGTYAARGSSGSNLGSAYGNSNRWDADDLDSDNPHAASTLDHANAAHDPDMWAADPTTAEQALLAEMLDLSPTCSSGNGWCSEFNHTILDVNGWPDLIVVGPWFSAWHVPIAVRTAAAARGIPIINFRAKHGVPEFGTELNNAPARLKSFSEHAQRYDALAQALGADPAVNLEVKQEFCREASAFKEATRGAHRSAGCARWQASSQGKEPLDPMARSLRALRPLTATPT